jgi:hypothetical protein
VSSECGRDVRLSVMPASKRNGRARQQAVGGAGKERTLRGWRSAEPWQGEERDPNQNRGEGSAGSRA